MVDSKSNDFDRKQDWSGDECLYEEFRLMIQDERHGKSLCVGKPIYLSRINAKLQQLENHLIMLIFICFNA